MLTNDVNILENVEKITQQFKTLLGNGFIRNALAAIEVPFQYRVAFDLMVHHGESYRADGYSMDDLYLGILGLSHYIYVARVEILPVLSRKVNSNQGPDALMEKMAADNMKANLGALGDRVSELYVQVVNLDKKVNNRIPFYKSYPELDMVGPLLTSQAPGLIPK